MTSLDAWDRIGVALGWFLGLLVLSGCATLGLSQPDNLLSKGCDKTYEDDIIVLTCETQDIVTRHCAKAAKKSDTGFFWDKDGRGPKGEYIGACAEWRPKNADYPFRIWIWKQEAWRRSHEEGCHIALWRLYGHNADHSQCADYGVGKPKKRL